MKPQAWQSRNPLGQDKVLSIILKFCFNQISAWKHLKWQTHSGICGPSLFCRQHVQAGRGLHKWNQSIWPNYCCVAKENTTSNLCRAWWMICCSECSNSYFRANLWRETETCLLSIFRGNGIRCWLRRWHILITLLPLLFVEEVVGCWKVSLLSLAPASKVYVCLYGWVVFSPKLLQESIKKKKKNRFC